MAVNPKELKDKTLSHIKRKFCRNFCQHLHSHGGNNGEAASISLSIPSLCLPKGGGVGAMFRVEGVKVVDESKIFTEKP